MVRVGFIVEGDTEAVLVDSSNFEGYLISQNVEKVSKAINAKGCRNLLPHKLENDVAILVEHGSQVIFILTDLDDDSCITVTKQRVNPTGEHVAIVSVREVEAWFLADTSAVRSFLRSETFYCENPESVRNPFEELNNYRSKLLGKKNRSKVSLARELIASGFSIETAALHPNCPSARYFLRKIEQLAEN